MRAAEIADANCILVTNVEWGGSFAYLLGTIMLMPEEDRRRIKAVIYNNLRGSPESIWEGADICFRAAMTLCGAFPFMFVLGKLLKKPLALLGKALKINETAAMGFVSTIVSNSPTLEMLNRMDNKGAVLNSAFLVTAAFVLGSHLGYTTSIDGSYVLPMMVAKFVAGIASVAVALFIYKRTYKEA